MKRLTRMNRRIPAGIAAGLFAFSTAPVHAQTNADAPAPAAPAPAASAATTSGDASIAPAPAIVPGSVVIPASVAAASAASGIPVQTLTLDQVVARALNNNSSILLAREKVLKAQQLIYEANAGGLPTVRVDIVDTLSSNKTFGTAGGGSNATGTLPGGGAIPVITDTGGGNAAGVTSSGGGGTATGAGFTSSGTTTTNATTATSASTTNTVPTNSTLGSGGTTSTGTTGTTGTGTTGTTSTGGTYGTTGPTAQVRSSSGELPPIMQQFTSAAKGGPTGGHALSAHDTTTGTDTGTGVLPGNGTLSTIPSNGHNNNYSGQVSITQGIDIFNLVPAAQDVERLTRDFYANDLIRVQNETVLSVKDQYFNVLRDQEQVIVYQEQVAADQESVRVTQAQVNAGSVAQFDLLTAQTTLSNAQQQLSSSQDTLTIAVDNLNNLLGIDADTPIALQVPVLPALNQTFDKAQLTQTAYLHRPELVQAGTNIVIAQRLVKLAGVGLLPSLSLVGSGNYAGYSSNGTHSTASLSAVLGIPLYDGGTTRAKIKEAESDLRSQKVTQGQLRENVSIEVRQALANITDAQTRASSAGLGAQQAAEAYRLANVRYKNGIGTILDVVNAQAQLAQARSNLVNAQYDYQTSLAQLTRAIGSR